MGLRRPKTVLSYDVTTRLDQTPNAKLTGAPSLRVRWSVMLRRNYFFSRAQLIAE